MDKITMIFLNSILIIYGFILFIYGKYFRKKDYLYFNNSSYIDASKDLFRNESIIESNEKLISINQNINKMENLIDD